MTDHRGGAAPTSRRRDDPVTADEPPRSRITSVDVARQAGVSASAVSLALNGRPGVSEATRQRILAAAAELNWLPNRAARALKDASSDVVGLAVARPASTLGVEPFFAQLLSGLQARLSRDGIALQILVVDDTEAEIETYRRWAAERRVDAAVLMDVHVDDPRPAIVSGLGLPAVVLGGTTVLPGVTTVWVDDHAAMTALVEHLAALGHRRLAHVTGTTTFLHTQRRRAALEELAAARDLRVRSVATDFSDRQGADATRALLAGPDRPSAIVFDSDVMAVAGLEVAGQLGVAVPDRVSLASFDDSVLTTLTHPSLTSLSRDTAALGALVAAELVGLLRGAWPPRLTQAPTPQLVDRESTAEPAR